MINDLLKQLGLGDKEVAVYLTVLKHGKITPGAVSRLTGINRTTVYSVAKELAEKHFIVEDLGTTNKFLIAIPPQNLESKKELIDDTIRELKEYAKNKEYELPKIMFISEDALEKYFYNQIFRWYDSMKKYDHIWWGFQDHSLVEHYQKWIDWQWREAAPKEIQLKLLSNESGIEQQMKSKGFARRQIKFWGGEEKFSDTTWVMGDYVVIVATREKPHYLIEINDALLARNMRMLLKWIWNKV